MKLQFGVLHRDHRIANEGDLAALLCGYQAWAAETSGHAFDGPLLIGYRGDRITWEEDTETQPFALGPHMLTFDGRLDNREDIASRVGMKAGRNLPDPVLISKAYAQYGDSIFPELMGEFALVLWRSDTRQLTFVRSVDGARPLYYVLDQQRLTWCSDFAHLVRASDVDRSVNESYMLEYLVSDPSPIHTPFRSVSVVPPGVSVHFAKDAFAPALRPWNPYDVQPIQCGSDVEYEERLRHEITEAVRVRMRTEKPVFSELSGGLDSSSVVMIGDQILRQANSEPQTLKTLSCVYEESQTCDETRFIRMVEEKRGVRTIYVHEHEQQLTLGLDDTNFTGLPNAMHVCPGRYPMFGTHMRQHGARVLLTGIGGDHIFCSDQSGATFVADCLRNWRFVKMHRECRLWSRFEAVPYLRILRQASNLVLTSEHPHRLNAGEGVPSWLQTGDTEQVFSQLWKINASNGAGSTPSMRCRAHTLEFLFSLTCLGMTLEYQDLYVSHPYTHRPLLEFCLGIPISQFLRSDATRQSCSTRSLMRRALSNVLPQQVALRISKGGMGEAIARAARRDLHSIGNITRWEVCQRGYVDPCKFERAINNMAAGVIRMSGHVLRVCMLEQWLRSLNRIKAIGGGTNNRQTSLAL
jgi:asparagine synthase (glutamine-hydrolysing)